MKVMIFFPKLLIQISLFTIKCFSFSGTCNLNYLVNWNLQYIVKLCNKILYRCYIIQENEFFTIRHKGSYYQEGSRTTKNKEYNLKSEQNSSSKGMIKNEHMFITYIIINSPNIIQLLQFQGDCISSVQGYNNKKKK